MSSNLPAPPPSPGPTVLATLGELWRHPATTQKIRALGLLVASLAVGGYGVMTLLQGSDEPVIRNLSVQEAASAIDRLKEAGIDARLGEDDGSVWVSAGDVDSATLILAGEGIAGGDGGGFEIIKDMGIGATDRLEDLYIRHALEGELARTIQTLDEVSTARVHLAPQRESVFESDEQPAKASVALRLERALSPGSAKSIVRFVAGSIQGLDPENVVVIDAQGRALHAVSEDEVAGSLTSEQIAQKEREERKIVSKVRELLVPIVGETGVVAKATVEMDFDQSEQMVETIEPVGSIVSQHTSKKWIDPRDRRPALGIPGVRSNVPDAVTAPAGANADPAATSPEPGATAAADPAAVPAPGIDGTLLEDEQITNYQPGRTVSTTTRAAGRVVRRSIAVVVDNPPPVENEDGEETVEPVSQERIEQFRALVITAAGLNLDAGDTVTVQNISFDAARNAPDFPEPSLLEQVRPYAGPLWRNVSWMLLVGALYLMFFKPALAKLSEPLPAAPEPIQEVALPSIEAEAAQALPEARNDDEEHDLLLQAQKVSQTSPQVASDLVRGWLSEES